MKKTSASPRSKNIVEKHVNSIVPETSDRLLKPKRPGHDSLMAGLQKSVGSSQFPIAVYDSARVSLSILNSK